MPERKQESQGKEGKCIKEGRAQMTQAGPERRALFGESEMKRAADLTWGKQRR